ncbi:MAG TPA: LysR family transcriptional regulator, partial [Roseovarius nubinhibens]|nr:LysR family transcriptional regulator [Roseovarius nubinhibens]
DEMRQATAALRPTPGRVTISVTPSFAAKWLIPNMAGLAERHPDVDLRILATEKVSSFHGDGIDLAVRQGRPPFGASIEAVLLFAQELIAVAAPELLGDRTVPVTPA